jgi:hypothetical protein
MGDQAVYSYGLVLASRDLDRVAGIQAAFRSESALSWLQGNHAQIELQTPHCPAGGVYRRALH